MFGLLYSLLAFILLLGTFNDLGFGYSVSYFIPKFLKQNNSRSIWNVFLYNLLIEVGTALLLSLVLILNAEWLATQYFKTQAATTLILIGSLYLISQSINSAFKRFFIGMQSEKLYAPLNTIMLALTFVGAVLVIFAPDTSVSMFGLAWLFGSACTAGISLVLFYRNFDFSPQRLVWDRILFRNMFSFAVPTLMNTSISSIIRASDIFFLTLFSGLLSAGQYNVIVPIAALSKIVVAPAMTIMMPLVSKLAVESQKEISDLVERIFRIIPTIGIYFALFIALFPDEIILLLFGENWANMVGLELRVLALGYPLTLCSGYLGSVVDGLGLVKQKLYVSVVVATLVVFIGGTLIYFYGLLGAIISNILIYAVSLVLNSYLIASKVRFTLPIALYAWIALLSLVVVIIKSVFGFSPQSFFELIYLGLSYTILVGLFVLSQDVLRDDSKLLLQVFKSPT